mmetsp:Transcript_671/g.1446  ORF Transcript_671/g.1446 Transcript_671/m.1446 type:complete len:210 (+) Transcript_671:405-1034(+)
MPVVRNGMQPKHLAASGMLAKGMERAASGRMEATPANGPRTTAVALPPVARAAAPASGATTSGASQVRATGAPRTILGVRQESRTTGAVQAAVARMLGIPLGAARASRPVVAAARCGTTRGHHRRRMTTPAVVAAVALGAARRMLAALGGTKPAAAGPKHGGRRRSPVAGASLLVVTAAVGMVAATEAVGAGTPVVAPQPVGAAVAAAR